MNQVAFHASDASEPLGPVKESDAPIQALSPGSGDPGILDYQALLAQLVSWREDSRRKDLILRALMMREGIALSSRQGDSNLDSQSVAILARADEALRSKAWEIMEALPPGTLQSWRQTIVPPEEHWWWWLERVANENLPKAHPIWTVVTLISTAVFLSLAAETTRRFLVGGAHSLALFATASQAFFAVVAGSTFTKAGKQWFERISGGRKPGRIHPAKLQAIFGLCLFALALTGFLRGLPWLASSYNKEALGLKQRGEYSEAISLYTRAVSLDNTNTAAHYNLGSALEAVSRNDEAITVYRNAISADPENYAAYNNLARRLMLDKKDSAEYAVEIIERALKLFKACEARQASDSGGQCGQEHTKAAIYRNLGWSRLWLGSFTMARQDLERSKELKVDPNTGYLLGLVQGELGETDQQKLTFCSWLEMATQYVQKENETRPAWREPIRGLEPRWRTHWFQWKKEHCDA